MDAVLNIFGKSHVLWLHLPIGILCFALLLRVYARLRGQDWQAVLGFCLACGAISALVSATSGYLLAQNGAYDAELVQKHQYWGIGAAFLSILSWWGYRKSYGFVLQGLSIIAIAVAGHLGGSLTHGSDFLWQIEAVKEENTANLHPEQPAFTALIQPILKAKCVRCHHSGKQKGELSMESLEAMLKGGKHGPALTPFSDKSLMLERVLLAPEAEAHMPPRGNTALSPQEIRILKEWILKGASDTLKTAALEAWQAEQKPRNPVWDLPIQAPSAAKLQELRKQGIWLDRQGENSPFFSVSMPNEAQCAQKLEKLAQISENIIALDLAGCPLNAEAFEQIARFTKLLRLQLARTPAQDSYLEKIKNLKYLEYLNLTQTKVSKNGILHLADMSCLQKCYLGQNGISAEELAALRPHFPHTRLEGEASPENEEQIALRPPKILYARTFFEDTVQVALDFPLKSIGLFYTLNNATPTPQSNRYEKPFVFQETTTLRAIAAKEGWLPSPVVEMSFIKRTKTPKSAELALAPAPQYASKGARSLYDGKIGDVQGADTWLGYQGKNLSATLDFGATSTFTNCYVHCLENNAPWIFAPRAIKIWASEDGKHFQPCAQRNYPVNASMGSLRIQLLSVPFDKPVQARYIKVEVLNLGKNPPWHPNKGEACWIFVDEIIFE